MFDWIFGKRLSQVVDERKKIRIKGVVFIIRKINPLDYLDGSKAVVQAFDVYRMKTPGAAVEESSIKKIKEHYADVILAGVVYPKLKRKEEEEGFLVDKIFSDWELAEKLYSEIMQHTYGKKKTEMILQKSSQGKG
jgi:hypothetical protein